MHELLSEFHVNLDLAFFLARPMFNHKISLKYDELRRLESSKDWKAKTEEEKQMKYVEATSEVRKRKRRKQLISK